MRKGNHKTDMAKCPDGSDIRTLYSKYPNPAISTSKAWAIFGHIPNPFTGKVETYEEFLERRGENGL